MKYFLGLLAALGILGVIVYFIPSLHAEAAKVLTYNECDQPLPYSLGTIDVRFGLTKDNVIQDLQEASDIWSSAKGKQLFVYKAGAPLTVSFVYDQRQAMDSQINNLQDNLQQNNQALTKEIAQYKADYAALTQKFDALNATIEKYNAQGGAPKDVYESLLKQQQELNAEAAALNQRAKQLNLSTNQYNSNVAVLNSDINQFNTVISQKPEEGLYDGNTDTITMFYGSNKKEIIHTLAHELGHSLGMMHVKDPKGIMYAYTTPYLAVTADDMTELSYVCRDQSAIIHGLQEFDVLLIKEFQSLRQQFAK